MEKQQRSRRRGGARRSHFEQGEHCRDEKGKERRIIGSQARPVRLARVRDSSSAVPIPICNEAEGEGREEIMVPQSKG